MSLFAPLAVTVEVRSESHVRSQGGANVRRVFRLSRAVAETALALERPAPFEIGRPVTATFALPDDRDGEALVLRAVIGVTDEDGDGEHGGRRLEFVDPPADAEDAIGRYLRDRLGLPRGASRP